MNKKIISIVLSMLFLIQTYAKEYIDVIKDKYLNKLQIPNNVFYINKPVIPPSDDFHLEVYRESTSDFLKFMKPCLNERLFPTEDSMTLESIKNALKEKKYIYEYPSSDYEVYDWISVSNADISIQYSQAEFGKIYGLGCFIIQIFIEDWVYFIRFRDNIDVEEQNDYFDKMKKYIYFRKGEKQDYERGIEGSQGYYMRQKNAPLFYNYLLSVTDENDRGYQFIHTFNQLLNSVKEIFN